MNTTRHLIHLPNDLSDRLADLVVTFMGSWRFIITQSVIVVFWIALNVLGFVSRWDAYPFILLNLLFSTQAAYASPLILMAQNRSSVKDRKRDDLESVEVEAIFKEVDVLLQIQNTQLALLREVQGLSQEMHKHLVEDRKDALEEK